MNKLVHATNLALAYDRNPILKGMNFWIETGNFVFITGASGSGKSTLLKSLYGAIKPHEGELEVGGVTMNRLSASKLNLLRQHLGIVFQDYKLVEEWTIEKNVMLPFLISGYSQDAHDARVLALLEQVNLKHQIGRYPKELSGGEQQRVAMARALLHNPMMILADEPTGNLDEYSSLLIWNLLVKAHVQFGTTIIVVTHHIPKGIGITYRHFHLEGGTLHALT